MIKDSHNKEILVSTMYFPPVSYLKTILRSETIILEQHENYIKQSYRNRCKIYAANGIINLSIPVVVATRKKVLIRDVQIDYATNWQKQHFKSIESAYRSSPFYEFLIGDFEHYFNRQFKFLFDFNYQILETVFEILDVGPKIELSSRYEPIPDNSIDLRNEIHPKPVNLLFKDKMPEYPQVFSAKFGFKKDLSCLDLLFNLGSEAYAYLTDRYSNN